MTILRVDRSHAAIKPPSKLANSRSCLGCMASAQGRSASRRLNKPDGGAGTGLRGLGEKSAAVQCDHRHGRAIIGDRKARRSRWQRPDARG